ncbi:MAG TPA: DUF1963 domain-containing protein [Gemmatimonadaceae bacterium]|nr:DUF1963 domain-containing protein [Gemmatimonadaceae bacterium]
MDIDRLQALNEKLARHRRAAWLPEVVEDDAAIVARSKFSGVPALLEMELWPRCGRCERPMQLFLQLDARDAPEAAAPALDGGVLQLFYCTSSEPHCEGECEAYLPHARSTLLRLLPPAELAPEREGLIEEWSGPAAMPEGMYPAKRIVAWTPVEDLPNLEELEGLGVELDDEDELALEDWDLPHAGEKLLGWPRWVQGVEYPVCRVCGRRMELLFQIDSSQTLPYMFGDMGIGHISQCPDHRTELAFGWACS